MLDFLVLFDRLYIDLEHGPADFFISVTFLFLLRSVHVDIFIGVPCSMGRKL